MKFQNRKDAGLQLAKSIIRNNLKFDLIITLPRGGVPIAKTIAEELGIQYYLMFIKKLGHPNNEEFAVGAISANGIALNEESNISATALEPQIILARKRISEMKLKFSHEIDVLSIKDKKILLVDDGIATGQCMQMAFHELEKHSPKLIVIGTPICPINAYNKLSPIVKIISILKPLQFIGISSFYEDFHQLTDQEVIRILDQKGHLKKWPEDSFSNG